MTTIVNILRFDPKSIAFNPLVADQAILIQLIWFSYVLGIPGQALALLKAYDPVLAGTPCVSRSLSILCPRLTK
jgi:hypothetical protein